MDGDERRKASQLLREKEAGDDVKLQWMYKASSKPDHEEYLLGKRKIAKVEDFCDVTEKDPNAPGAIFEDDSLVAARAQLDMHAKMREDPLFAIKQQEEDVKKKILMNPVKMKHLQKRLSEMKKSRRKKKKKRGSDDSSDSDDEVMKKYLQILTQKMNKESHKQDKSERHSKHDKNDRKRSDSPKQSSSYRRSRSPSPTRSKRRSRSPKQYNRRSRSPRQYNRRSTSPEYNRRRRSRSRERHPRQRSRSPRRSSPDRGRQGRARSPPSKQTQGKKKLSSEEMERKRREMMSDAEWRDEQRVQNVKRYKEEDMKEKDEIKKGSKEDFINPMMAKHASMSSVEDRIKRNKYNIQRTSLDLDKNFTKK